MSPEAGHQEGDQEGDRNDARHAAERLLQRPVRSVFPAAAGANSRVFCIETDVGRLALKSYPERAADARRRAETEWQALTFLRHNGVSCVPEPIARDADGRYLVMEWLIGTPVTTHQLSDVAHAAEFVVQIFALSMEPSACQFTLASEACLSSSEIVSQIEHRLAEFLTLPALTVFLEQEFAPALAKAKERFSREDELDPKLRRLIPADFGFHNALREPGGSLRYVDFDYFGWDDPVKLTADFFLHPAVQLDADQRNCFLTHIVTALPDDVEFNVRLGRHMPLYALRWALILLNPFRIERSAALPSDRSELQQLLTERIAKAQAFVQRAGEL